MVGLGVADGVYMWKTQGIDAGLYSRTLMTAARSEVEGGSSDALAGALGSTFGASGLAAPCFHGRHALPARPCSFAGWACSEAGCVRNI